jgi:hypothetical protein
MSVFVVLFQTDIKVFSTQRSIRKVFLTGLALGLVGSGIRSHERVFALGHVQCSVERLVPAKLVPANLQGEQR